jgi:hypothetical protein
MVDPVDDANSMSVTIKVFQLDPRFQPGERVGTGGGIASSLPDVAEM